MNSTVEGLERGVTGTADTIEKMHKLVALGKLDPTLQNIASWIRLGVPEDRRGKTHATADAIFDFCKQHGVFQSDPFQIEKIESPLAAFQAVVRAKQAGTYSGPGLFIGDCDTFAIVTATLGGILGFQYAFETAKVDAQRPDEFSHVWTDLIVDGEPYALDSSTSGAYPGWKPPVGPDLLRIWSEQPIENVVRGADMSAFNRGGLADGDQRSPLADVDAVYPKDYISYGMPKNFGQGPGVIPESNFDEMQLLPPHETAIPSADLEPDMHLLKAAPTVDPSERVRRIAGFPDDHGNPYYKTSDQTPRVKIERQFYPPGSRWNGSFGQDAVRYVKTGAYVKVKSAESPERQVRTTMSQPQLLRRRVIVSKPAQRLPYGAMEGYGMGDDGDTSGIVTSLDTPFTSTAPTEDQVTNAQVAANAAPVRSTPVSSSPSPIITSLNQDPTTGKVLTSSASTPTQQQQAAAGTSVWDALSSAFKAAGTAAPAVMQSQAMQSVIAATNKLAGKNVLGTTTPTSWYSNPWVIAAALLGLGGAAYVTLKSRPTSRRRR